jgi:hypothetical protein
MTSVVCCGGVEKSGGYCGMKGEGSGVEREVKMKFQQRGRELDTQSPYGDRGDRKARAKDMVEDQQIKHTKECEEKRSNAATMRTNRCQS